MIKKIIGIVDNIKSGFNLDYDTSVELISTPENELMSLLWGSNALREHYHGKTLSICSIVNAKSGECSEDCIYCAQSRYSKTSASIYPLISEDELLLYASEVSKSISTHFGIVTSGKRVSNSEIKAISSSIEKISKLNNCVPCASLGTLSLEHLHVLKNAGLTRYHHNLEAARSFFNKVCTTHSYDDRFSTIKNAKEAGLEVCCGGLFGLGEKPEHVVELALEIRELNVDSIPLNFLVPIKGTLAYNIPPLKPLDILKIISMFRYINPDKTIRVCGGRELNLRDLQAMIFYAGANGFMLGNYLTTSGRSFSDDLQMLKDLNLLENIDETKINKSTEVING